MLIVALSGGIHSSVGRRDHSGTAANQLIFVVLFRGSDPTLPLSFDLPGMDELVGRSLIVLLESLGIELVGVFLHEFGD